MKLRLRSVAEADAAEAIRWYAEQKPDLAARFFEALSFTLRSIEHNPELYPAVDGETRRALFPKPFPRARPLITPALFSHRPPFHREKREKSAFLSLGREGLGE